MQGFACLTIVEFSRVDMLASARAAGIRSAHGPVVYLGETHSYPLAGWARTLIEAHRGDWAGVVAGFANGLQENSVCWACLLLNCSPWLQGRKAREVHRFPTWNTAYKREILLELGERLDSLLAFGDALQAELIARGRRFYFEPDAAIEHLNVLRLGVWLRERFWGGLLTAHYRAAKWSRFRRCAYLLGSPLIPAVMLWRGIQGFWAVKGQVRAPVATLGAMLAGALVMSYGEILGYAGWPVAVADREMDDYQLHKADYVDGLAIAGSARIKSPGQVVR